jgi:hypothetical protein
MNAERQLKAKGQVLQTKQALLTVNNQLLKSIDHLIKTLEQNTNK